MAAAKSKNVTVDEVIDEVVEAPKSMWEEILDEANENYEPPKPFLFDAYDPAIEITAPDSLERSLALATLLDVDGNVSPDDMRPMLEALFGEDAFPYVWAKIRNKHPDVTHYLVERINKHFHGDATNGAKKLPGGSQGS